MKFACFDIGKNYQWSLLIFKETLYKTDDDLQLVSVGTSNNITNEAKYFERESSSAESGQDLIDKFMTHLLEVYDKFESLIDPAILKAKGNLHFEYFLKRKLEEIESIIEENGFTGCDSNLYRFREFLSRLTTLSVFSFNGAKFDNVMVVPYLGSVFTKFYF